MMTQIASLAAVGFLVWLAWALGFRGNRRIAGEAEMLALSEPHGGAQQCAIDTGGKSAIALLNDGRLLVAKIVGDRITTRIFDKGAIASIDMRRANGLQVRVRFKDFGFASLRLDTLDSAPQLWLGNFSAKTGIT